MITLLASPIDMTETDFRASRSEPTDANASLAFLVISLVTVCDRYVPS